MDGSHTGHVGSLSPFQEQKLKQLWKVLFHLGGVLVDENCPETMAFAMATPPPAEEAAPPRRTGFFRRSAPSTAASSDPFGANGGDDKFGLAKKFHETLAKVGSEALRDSIWAMVRSENPDAVLLRFLRARKWDVQKALIMLVSAVGWRLHDMNVDDIMRNGEAAALADEKAGHGDVQKMGHDFMEQLRMGKSLLHGRDRQGRPISVIRVHLHHWGGQSPESIERYTVHLIETTRLVLESPVETGTIVFDMTHFGLANMDYGPVKFIIRCFEANYPESLGNILIHNAPWIFNPIWKVIRAWLDPVVAAKVHLTHGRKGIEEFIAPEQLIKELGGDEDFEYKYLEPVEGENDRMKDTETRDCILKTRGELQRRFEEATIQWIRDDQGAADTRLAVAAELRTNYWTLDPYVRARSHWDRAGIIDGKGNTRWYASEREKADGEADKAVADRLDTDKVDDLVVSFAEVNVKV
ncbi:putative phosphatidylinositol transfer protein csr1 protein [Drechmeria coniospora]|uniref:Putative phosphatidylinositol transfer protein csr1 protein n=1 Tax=Drechmeria coniospora TaxID=98403 RepID=A0A151GVJ0_DRECN|nr:putative phosphatidylinositol transfer protein csr1 protein [Drechmeria coniospora]KYK61119.1 putative phosphatidylinositol transfer protein csr1 protein [Drechmeria coniospora]